MTLARLLQELSSEVATGTTCHAAYAAFWISHELPTIFRGSPVGEPDGAWEVQYHRNTGGYSLRVSLGICSIPCLNSFCVPVVLHQAGADVSRIGNL